MLFEISKKILSFFTTWVFILFGALITFRKKFTARHEKMIVCMTLAVVCLDFIL